MNCVWCDRKLGPREPPITINDFCSNLCLEALKGGRRGISMYQYRSLLRAEHASSLFNTIFMVIKIMLSAIVVMALFLAYYAVESWKLRTLDEYTCRAWEEDRKS